MPAVRTCPTCGVGKLRRVTRDVECNFRGHVYIAPDIEFSECPNCGEKLYDQQALRKMESFRPKGRRKARVA
jgi:YgiT-type zinc finger domain-containing protein